MRIGIAMAAWMPAEKPLLRWTFNVFEALPSELVNWHVKSSPSLLRFKGTLNFMFVQVSLLLISTPFIVDSSI